MGGALRARLFLLFAMIIAIASIAGSGFVMSEKFLSQSNQYNWAGISCLVSTLVITASAFFMRFLTLPPSEAY